MRNRWRQPLVVVLVILFFIVNLGNALHKGGDFESFRESSRRLLNSEPLYAGSSPGAGVTWPPFQSVFFVPFVFVEGFHPDLARVLWYLVNFAGLFIGVFSWTHSIFPGRFLTFRELLLSNDVLLPLAAVALAAETNFEHQNMNPLLLAITGIGALALVRGRYVLGSLAFSVASGLKAFPVLLFCVFPWRRAWGPLLIGILIIVCLSCSVGFRYGVPGTMDAFRSWTAISLRGGWPIRPQNQSIYAMFSRILPDHVRTVQTIATFCLMAAVFIVGWRRRRLPLSQTGSECAFVLAVAVLVSPIAWEHYWVLFFPLFQVVRVDTGERTMLRSVFFWLAAILVSGFSPLLVGEAGYNFARSLNNSTIAGLLLIAVAFCELLKATPNDGVQNPARFPRH
jgi:hypothetical protein